MKKNILVVFGIGDTFCIPNSIKFLKSGEKIYKDVEKLIVDNKKNYHAFLNIQEIADRSVRIYPFSKQPRSKIIDIKLFNPNIMSSQNHMIIHPSNEKSGEDIVKLPDYIEVLFHPREYNVSICGIDINGAFVNFTKDLINLGYYITVYSDIIKPFNKDTITFLIEKSQNKQNHLRFGKS